jgi:hypothetical protein
MMTLSVTSFGPFRHLVIPVGWKGIEPKNMPDMRQWKSYANEADPTASINVYYRGVPISDEGAALVRNLIATQPKADERELTDDEKAGLREFLGHTSVGSNQYTDPEVPVFDLDSAKFVWLGDHPGFFVRGRFKYTRGNQEKKEFAGVFLPCGEDRREVYELFFQAGGLKAFEQHYPEFEKVLHSLLLRAV